MAKSAESPHTTRRRVWTFVFGCLVLLLTVALWPLKGYRIRDEGAITDHVGGHRFGPSESAGLMPPFYSETNRNARKTFEDIRLVRLEDGSGYGIDPSHVAPLPDIDPKVRAVVVRISDEFGIEHDVCFTLYRNNMVLAGNIDCTRLASGETPEQRTRDIVSAILDGIDREIPGVTTFYNPPARQLYYDRVRPFLSEHFPEAFAP